jgi:putative nucleotidyltransferase with HDIG domain
MSFRAKALIAVIVALGTVAAAYAALNATSSGATTFAALFVLCVAISLLRVVLPGIQGNLSLSYVLLLWGIAHLDLGETILMGCASALVQSYWRCQRRPQPVQVVFNLALISLSVAIGRLAFSSAVAQWLVPGEVVRILLASVAYFVVNTSCVAAIIALTEARPVWNVWRASYLWTLPHYLLGASIVVATQALIEGVGLQIVLLVVPVAYLVYHTFQMHIAGLNQAIERADVERRHAEATANLHLRTIRALALAIEAKDRTTGEHLHRVQTYAMELGKEFGLCAEDMAALRAAAILHDIGKIAVPEHIISKPAKLTPEEFGKMKIHPIVGAEIIESVNFPFPVAQLVRAHHEKWDGSGYPYGLRAEEIPLGARILTAVDCLDALASDRHYRKAMPLDAAMAVVRAESGKSFDPRVVDALSKKYRELEQLARVTLEGANSELSTELRVWHGVAPDAGFATGWDSAGGADICQLAPSEVPVIESIHAEISRLDSVENTLAAIWTSLRSLIPFDCLALYLKQNGILRCVYCDGRCAELINGMSITPGEGVSGWVFQNGKPLLNGNALAEFGLSRAVPPGFDLQTALAIALDSEFGPAAVLTLYSREKEAFVSDHLRVLLAIESSLSYYLRLSSSGVMPAPATSPRATRAAGVKLRQLCNVLHSEDRSGSMGEPVDAAEPARQSALPFR